MISAIDEAKTWNSGREYIAALESRPLGPNIASFIGHSDIRTATMGLDRATRGDTRPTSGEQAQMERMLAEALDAGFLGMSSQQLLFDKIDGATCRSRTLPSTYAKPRELRRLKTLLRKRGRVLQSGPDITNPLNLVSQVAQSLPVLRDKLKTSLLSAADIKANPFAIAALGPVARLVNRLGADFRWQHLPVPFEVYADGIDLVVFEEFGSGAAALHLRDEIERNALLNDENYRRRFRKEYDSRFGVRVWHRDFFDAEIVGCPDESVIGKSFGQVGLWSSSTGPSCAGEPRSRTTGPRCSRNSPATTEYRWVSPTPVRICAICPSTTSGCGCCGTSETPSAAAVRSCRSNMQCIG